MSGLFEPFPVTLRDAEGREVEAVAYRAAQGRRLPAEAPPSPAYLEVLRRGGREVGLSAEWLARLDSLGARPEPAGASPT